VCCDSTLHLLLDQEICHGGEAVPWLRSHVHPFHFFLSMFLYQTKWPAPLLHEPVLSLPTTVLFGQDLALNVYLNAYIIINFFLFHTYLVKEAFSFFFSLFFFPLLSDIAISLRDCLGRLFFSRLGVIYQTSILGAAFHIFATTLQMLHSYKAIW
jgi:hypothetical protein